MGQGIELLWEVEGDCGNLALSSQSDLVVGGRHAGLFLNIYCFQKTVTDIITVPYVQISEVNERSIRSKDEHSHVNTPSSRKMSVVNEEVCLNKAEQLFWPRFIFQPYETAIRFLFLDCLDLAGEAVPAKLQRWHRELSRDSIGWSTPRRSGFLRLQRRTDRVDQT